MLIMVTQMIWVYRNGDNVDTAATSKARISR